MVDVTSMVAGSFSSWFNPAEGSFVVDYDSTGSANNRALITATDGSSNERLYSFLASTTAAPTLFVADGGTQQASIANGAISGGTMRRTAWAYRQDDFVITTDGATPAADAAGTLPMTNELQIGHFGGANQLNGHMRWLQYFQSRLSNTQLQALTS